MTFLNQEFISNVKGTNRWGPEERTNGTVGILSANESIESNNGLEVRILTTPEGLKLDIASKVEWPLGFG